MIAVPFVWAFKNWRVLAGAALALVLAYFVWSYRERGQDLAEQTALAENLEAQLVETTQIYETYVTALERKATNDKSRKDFAAQNLQAIGQGEDGPAAGVLLDTVGRLHARAAARAQAADSR